jgi:hypothetical protein
VPSAKQGWAVKDTQGVNMRTVSESPVGAMVNWLYTSAQQDVFASMSDDDIKHKFAIYGSRAHVVRVSVIELPDG